MATDWILITSLASLRWVLTLIFPLWVKKFLFCSKQFESSFCDLQLKESWQIRPQTRDISCILGSSYCFSLDLEIGSGMFGASSPSYLVQESAVWMEDPFGFLVKYQCIRGVTSIQICSASLISQTIEKFFFCWTQIYTCEMAISALFLEEHR